MSIANLGLKIASFLTYVFFMCFLYTLTNLVYFAI